MSEFIQTIKFLMLEARARFRRFRFRGNAPELSPGQVTRIARFFSLGPSKAVVISIRRLQLRETRHSTFLLSGPSDIARQSKRRGLHSDTPLFEVVVRGKFASHGQGGVIAVSDKGESVVTGMEGLKHQSLSPREPRTRDVRLLIHGETGGIVMEEPI
jgi:hypothetical protein